MDVEMSRRAFRALKSDSAIVRLVRNCIMVSSKDAVLNWTSACSDVKISSLEKKKTRMRKKICKIFYP